MSTNAQQEPAPEPLDVEASPPPLPEVLPQPAAGAPEAMPDPSSQAEVEAMTNTGGLNNAVPSPEDVPLALDTPLGAGLVSNHPPMVEDALMMALDEDDAKGDDAQEENASVELENSEEKMGMMGSKTPLSSNPHVAALSDGPRRAFRHRKYRSGRRAVDQ